MSDIVEKLRHGHFGSGIGPRDCKDALDEIERLRGDLIETDATVEACGVRVLYAGICINCKRFRCDGDADPITKEAAMKFVIAAAAILVTTGAFAQEKAPDPIPAEKTAPVASPAPVRYHLDLDQADLNAISAAINELPKRIADPLIARLNEQLQDQQPKKGDRK